MIDHKELRIGNWVINNSNNNTFQMDSGGDFMNLQSASWLWLSGIPLTPNILEKCGFKTSSKWEHAELNNLIITWGRGKAGEVLKECYVLNYIGLCCYGESKPVYFLHQLQNLYFALTGTELEINNL